jgi:hypothetical protein
MSERSARAVREQSERSPKEVGNFSIERAVPKAEPEWNAVILMYYKSPAEVSCNKE